MKLEEESEEEELGTKEETVIKKSMDANTVSEIDGFFQLFGAFCQFDFCHSGCESNLTQLMRPIHSPCDRSKVGKKSKNVEKKSSSFLNMFGWLFLLCKVGYFFTI